MFNVFRPTYHFCARRHLPLGGLADVLAGAPSPQNVSRPGSSACYRRACVPIPTIDQRRPWRNSYPSQVLPAGPHRTDGAPYSRRRNLSTKPGNHACTKERLSARASAQLCGPAHGDFLGISNWLRNFQKILDREITDNQRREQHRAGNRSPHQCRSPTHGQSSLSEPSALVPVR